MEPPVGFETRKRADGPKTSNIQAPRLVPELQVDSNPVLVHKQAQLTSKRNLRPQPAPNVAAKASLTLNNSTSTAGIRHKPRPSFIMPPKEKNLAGKEKNTTGFRVLVAPDLPGPSKVDTTRLRPHPPPPRPPQPQPPPSKSIIPLKYLQPPRPPTPIDVTAITDKPLRTISTTEIALATDLFTDSGTAELAHIFLRDQHPDIVDHREEPARWHIGLSPQKGHYSSKGKGKEKFIK